MNEVLEPVHVPKDRAAVILFFAVGHYESVKALSTLHRIAETYRARGVAVGAVAVDPNKAVVTDFVRDMKHFNWKFSIGWDEGRKVSAQYTIPELPSYYVVHKDGHIVLARIGLDCNEEGRISSQLTTIIGADPVADEWSPTTKEPPRSK